MKIFKQIIIILFLISFSTNINANSRPGSFADLAEKLMPSVVNISTTLALSESPNFTVSKIVFEPLIFNFFN